MLPILFLSTSGHHDPHLENPRENPGEVEPVAEQTDSQTKGMPLTLVNSTQQ